MGSNKERYEATSTKDLLIFQKEKIAKVRFKNQELIELKKSLELNSNDLKDIDDILNKRGW